MPFTFLAASFAFAIAGSMSLTNAVKAKLFRGDNFYFFVDILNSVAGYWFVIFAIWCVCIICSRRYCSLNGLSDILRLSTEFLSVHLRIVWISSLNPQFCQLWFVLTLLALIRHSFSNKNPLYQFMSFNLTIVSKLLMYVIRLSKKSWMLYALVWFLSLIISSYCESLLESLSFAWIYVFMKIIKRMNTII